MSANRQDFLRMLEDRQLLFNGLSSHSVLQLSFFDSPIGLMCHISDDERLYVLEFLDRQHIDTELVHFCQHLHCQLVQGETALTTEINHQLSEYFMGIRYQFTLPTAMIGTPFQQLVWRSLQAIPFAHTWSYQQQASYIGRPQAVRAVARTNGQNRMCIIYPCHRVIGSNGALTGYAGGLERKQWLLQHEMQCQ